MWLLTHHPILRINRYRYLDLMNRGEARTGLQETLLARKKAHKNEVAVVSQLVNLLPTPKRSSRLAAFAESPIQSPRFVSMVSWAVAMRDMD